MWYRPFLPELGTKAFPRVGEGTVQVACLSPQACLRPTRLPFPLPLSGQQWSGAQVLMGPSEGWAWHNEESEAFPWPTGDGKCLE